VSDRARLWLMIWGALWLLVWGYSFVAFSTAVPDDVGATRGAKRIQAFLLWQGIATLVALPVWAMGLGWPRRSGVRRISAVPISLALLLLAAILGLIAWVRFWP
jgi:hypothetical protein